MKASESDNFTFHDKDIVAVTEAVVGIAMGNYVTVDEIAKDIKNKFGTNHIGVVFPILSRNRFAVLLSAIARAMDKITLQIYYLLCIELSFSEFHIQDHLLQLPILENFLQKVPSALFRVQNFLLEIWIHE